MTSGSWMILSWSSQKSRPAVRVWVTLGAAGVNEIFQSGDGDKRRAPEFRQRYHEGSALEEGGRGPPLLAPSLSQDCLGQPHFGTVCVSADSFTHSLNNYRRPVLCRIHSGRWTYGPDPHWCELVRSPRVPVAATGPVPLWQQCLRGVHELARSSHSCAWSTSP